MRYYNKKKASFMVLQHTHTGADAYTMKRHHFPPPAFLRDGEKERQHIPAPHTPQNKGRTSEKIK